MRTVLKSLKTKRSGRKSKKKLAGPGPGQNCVFGFGPGRAGPGSEISISLSGLSRLGRKFQFLFRAGQRPNRNFFGAGSGPGFKNPARLPLMMLRCFVPKKLFRKFFFSSPNLKTFILKFFIFFFSFSSQDPFSHLNFYC